MKKRILILFTFCLILNSVFAHPFYVSVTQIDYKENSLQITLKVFIDDLESTLNQVHNQPKLFLGEKNENENSTQIIQNYINENLSLKVNGGNTEPYIFVGKETENDVVWIYLEVKRKFDKISSLEIKNSIITEKYEGQTNLIHTNINGEKKSLILNKATPKDIINF